MTAETLLAQHLVDHHRDEAAAALEGRPIAETAGLFGELGAASVARVAGRMEPAAAAAVLAQCEDAHAADVLEGLPAEAAVAVLRRASSAERERWLARTDAETAERLGRVLTYPDGCAGATMDPNVTALPDDVTVKNALRRVRRGRTRPGSYLYVTDREGRLTGVITLRELLLAEAERRLKDVAAGDVVALQATDPVRVVCGHHGWRSYHALPVSEADGRVVGVIPYDTMRRLESELAEEGPADAVMLGATLGRAWIALTAALLDGLAASWETARRREVDHGS